MSRLGYKLRRPLFDHFGELKQITSSSLRQERVTLVWRCLISGVGLEAYNLMLVRFNVQLQVLIFKVRCGRFRGLGTKCLPRLF